jgi:tripartite ATP-independent transporter DctP family solute receptor
VNRSIDRRTFLGMAAAGTAALAGSRPARSQSKPIVGRLSHVKTVEEPFHIVITKVAERIKDRTNGELEIKIYPAGQLGQENAAGEAVTTGSIDMALMSASGLGAFHPPFGAFIAPYAFQDWAEVRKVVDGPLGAELSEQLSAKKNKRALEYFNDGTRVIVTREKPIHSVSDLQGLKMRVPPSKLFLETFKAFGASATPLSYGDLFPALQQGVVDGCDFGLALVAPAKAYDFAKHVSITRHMVTALVLTVNSTWQDSLPPELRAILSEEMRKGSDEITQMVVDGEASAVNDLTGFGMTIVENPDIESFKAAAAVVPDIMKADWGDGFWEKLLAAKAA